MEQKIGIHCFVSGHVQGVWYRASTQKVAKDLSLTGWARNLPDGRVEVMAFGEKSKLQELHHWLKKGPELANVTEVTYEEILWQSLERFGIG
ncbi:acylphosphatase [Gammaproteobacteria bacterium SCGC AG-212-F23]|nr:acylphosphatase [Gammaproteobacteria bacterium SCGC AG-212-F23]